LQNREKGNKEIKRKIRRQKTKTKRRKRECQPTLSNRRTQVGKKEKRKNSPGLIKQIKKNLPSEDFIRGTVEKGGTGEGGRFIKLTNPLSSFQGGIGGKGERRAQCGKLKKLRNFGFEYLEGCKRFVEPTQGPDTKGREGGGEECKSKGNQRFKGE